MHPSRARAYFNHAGLSRPRPSVVELMRAAERDYNDFLFSEAGVEMYYAMLAECRRAAAAVMGLEGARGISLLAGATSAVQLALSALGANLGPGDLVITSDQEHPCVTRPLNLLARKGVEIAEIAAPLPAEFLERVATLIAKRRPAFVILSQVSYKNGRILPVGEVGAMLAAKEIPYIVDGAQAFGHIPLDVAAMQAAVYIFSGHKWLAGPWGTGGLWTSSEFALRNRVTLSSWEEETDPPAGGRYEGGTMNYSILAGLAEACRNYVAEQNDRIAALTRLRDDITSRVDGIYPAAAAPWDGPIAPGILAYLMPSRLNSCVLAREILDRFGVAIKPFRPPERPDAVRISFSPTTSVGEIDLLDQAMHAASGAPQ